MIPAFLLTFREALEAALIVAIVVGYLTKIGRKDLHRQVWLATLAAVGLSLALGMVLLRIYGGLEGTAEQLFEGIAALLAAAVLTHMIFWMARNGRVREEMENRLRGYVTRGFVVGVVALAFISVFREGVETVLFLLAATFVDPAGTLAGAALGIGVAVVLGLLLLRQVARLPIKKFFLYSSVLLIIFAAGLAGFGAHELMEAYEDSGGSLSGWSATAYDINPPANTDGSYPWLHEKGAVGSVLKALVGYDGDPEWLRVVVYLGYWLVVGGWLMRSHRRALPETSPSE